MALRSRAERRACVGGGNVPGGSKSKSIFLATVSHEIRTPMPGQAGRPGATGAQALRLAAAAAAGGAIPGGVTPATRKAISLEARPCASRLRISIWRAVNSSSTLGSAGLQQAAGDHRAEVVAACRRLRRHRNGRGGNERHGRRAGGRRFSTGSCSGSTAISIHCRQRCRGPGERGGAQPGRIPGPRHRRHRGTWSTHPSTNAMTAAGDAFLAVRGKTQFLFEEASKSKR